MTYECTSLVALLDNGVHGGNVLHKTIMLNYIINQPGERQVPELPDDRHMFG